MRNMKILLSVKGNSWDTYACLLWKKTSTLSLLNYAQAGHGNDTTLWLLQAEIRVLLSGAGESKTSDKFSPSDSILQQQLRAGKEMQEYSHWYNSKACMQAKHSCNEMWIKGTSPCFTLIHESVYAVKRRKWRQLRNENMFDAKLLTKKNTFIQSECKSSFDINCAITHLPYAPKVKLLFWEKDKSSLFALSMPLASLWMFVLASLPQSQSGAGSGWINPLYHSVTPLLHPLPLTHLSFPFLCPAVT